MALQCNYSKFGTTFENAYVRIENLRYVAKPHTKLLYPNSTTQSTNILQRGEPVSINETKKRCNLIVSVYTSSQARDNNETPIDVLTNYIYNMEESDSGDLMLLCYNYLKTLPEFTGAVDV